MFPINADIFATAHEDGDFKLWNSDSGEGLYTYQWKSVVKCLFYDT